MAIAAIIRELESLATKDTRAMAERRSVAEATLLGVSTAALRKLAKKLGEDAALAEELWHSKFHEAHVLAILIAPLNKCTANELSEWVLAIDSWSLCDKLAKRLAGERTDTAELARLWAPDHSLYVRRTGLALIANRCMKLHALDEELSQLFLSLVELTAPDDRPNVRQACCWALRELGKIDSATHELAINLALELIEDADTAKVWVGKCAHKELELLVKIPERRRLISRTSKTAAKYES